MEIKYAKITSDSTLNFYNNYQHILRNNYKTDEWLDSSNYSSEILRTTSTANQHFLVIGDKGKQNLVLIADFIL